MKKLINSFKLLVILGICLVGIYTLPLYAQTDSQPEIENSQETEGILPVENGCERRWNKKDLVRLRKKNPEKFKELSKKHQLKTAERLSRLKQEDPEKFERVMKCYRLNRVSKLKDLKEQDPEKFKSFIQTKKNKVKQQLAKLKEGNPQKYEKLVKCHRNLNKLRKLMREDPEKFEQFINNHPEIGDYLTGKEAKHPCR
ncbi:MAG: hypothetical protein ABIH08_07990 [Candidatus Omnitrophota bacterium]